MIKRKFAIVLTMVFFFTQVGCATAPKRVLSLAEARFQEDWTYKIDLTRDGKSYQIRAKGNEIEKGSQDVVVKRDDGSVVAVVGNQEIQKIEGERKTSSYALPGLGIGAASLALAGGLAVGLQSCEGSGDPGDCEGLRTVGLMIGIGGGALFGGLIGFGIGAMIAKKSRVTITPTGLGVSLPF